MRQTSVRDVDVMGVDSDAPQSARVAPGKITRAQGGSVVQARASDAAAPTGAPHRMGGWQPTSLLGAMGLSFEGDGVQFSAEPSANQPHDAVSVHAAADRGISGSSTALPHREAIQRAFGAEHDVSGIKAHVGDEAADATSAMGAQAYAKGNHVAFREQPSLHTAAHEAAHVVQQRGGVHLKGGVGESGDSHEQHADAVADAVVRGESAKELLADYSPRGTSSSVVQRQDRRTTVDGGVSSADVAAVRSKLAAARAILADPRAGLSQEERAQLRATIADAEAALSSYDELASQGGTRTAWMGGLAIAGGGILADDATVVGVADDPLLILVGIGLLATLLVTRPKAPDVQLQTSWANVVSKLQEVALAGEVLISLKINGEKIRGNTEQLAKHLARLLALAGVAGVASGEPPKNNNDNDPHWWKEIKAFLKNIKDGIGDASRKQAMRELQKKFTEQEILEIERRLAEAARQMGENPPPFLPPP